MNKIVKGDVTDLKTGVNLTKKLSYQALPRVSSATLSKLDIRNAIQFGSGTKSLYVFSDPDCTYCRQLQSEIGHLIKKNDEASVERAARVNEVSEKLRELRGLIRSPDKATVQALKDWRSSSNLLPNKVLDQLDDLIGIKQGIQAAFASAPKRGA